MHGRILEESGIGLYYYGARYYDAALGRFLQADNIIPDAMNSQAFDRYAYTYNNPINFTDPTGHFCTKVGPNIVCSADDDSSGWWSPLAINDIFASFEYPYLRPAAEYNLSPAGLEFIKQSEGFYPNLYNDGLAPNDLYFYDTNGMGTGNCTIGYGTLVHYGPCNHVASEAQYINGINQDYASTLLLIRLKLIEAKIRREIMAPITQSQYDALVSYTYNTGQEAGVINYLNQGDYENAGIILGTRPITSNGVVMPGLIKRRQAEQNMFLRSPYLSLSELLSINLSEFVSTYR